MSYIYLEEQEADVDPSNQLVVWKVQCTANIMSSMSISMVTMDLMLGPRPSSAFSCSDTCLRTLPACGGRQTLW
ncbi:hypothetical protein EYF80_056204 [Liparis tanakae]|uniref:Uncharacterized protein n=1 Tax=Liparis tanakae TaxID=230148 RepID=A0A4Z2EY15_9TELE|nr:hypothetical protein EYF80_056204 [Liparis tanakae]